jgi:hypothetical protein
MRDLASAPSFPTKEKTSTYVQMRTCFYAATILCYLIVKVGNVVALAPMLSVLSLAAILVSLPACGWPIRVLTALFLGGGMWMLYQKGIAWPERLQAFGQMMYLLSLFAVLPILATPVKLGGYSRAIQAVLQGRITGVFQLNCLVTALAFVCGSFVTMAAIPIMVASMSPVIGAYPIKDKVRFMAVSATYGYLLPLLWTPVSAVIGAILYILNVDWFSVFPTLLMLSLASLVANWVIFYLLEVRGEAKSMIVEKELSQSTSTPHFRPLVQMVLGIVLLVIAVILMEELFHIGLITIVTLVAVPFAFAWSAVIGQGKAFVTAAGQSLSTNLPRMAEQFAIFLSTGFFAGAMRLSGFDHTANLAFLDLLNAIGTQMFLILLPVMALLASCLGIHPIVAITLVAESLKPEVLGITSDQLAITLVGSCILTYMLGPFSGTLGLVQSVLHVSTFRLSWWNLPYALGYFVLLSATIMLI